MIQLIKLSVCGIIQMIITTIEDIFLGLTLFFLFLYIVASLIDKKPHWFLSKSFIKARKMQKDYEKLVQSRRDLLHHYFWSEQNKEKQKMKKMQKDIEKLDKELEEMRSQYECVRKGLPVPLKIF